MRPIPNSLENPDATESTVYALSVAKTNAYPAGRKAIDETTSRPPGADHRLVYSFRVTIELELEEETRLIIQNIRPAFSRAAC